jgi:tetratricopeptide (TPR) repeat protein
MVKINSGLTGNYEQDAKYLMAQYKIYENHEDYEEISRAIRAFMYNLIPNDKAFALKKTTNNKTYIENILSKVENMMQKNDFNKALEVMEILINELEKTLEIFSDDDINEFHNFDEFFEEQIYMEVFKPMKKMRQMPWNFALAYLKYGIILFELKEFDKAKIFLKKANKINPINVYIMFELSEISKINKNWDEYIKITNKCLEYAYSSEGLARCYRNYGYYFIEQNDYETAIAAYCIAMIFSFGIGKKFPQLEMQYLRKLTRKTDAEIAYMLQNNLGEMVKKLKKYNIQLGANKAILTLALTLAMSTEGGNQNSVAEDCILTLRDIARYKEIYDLVGDEEINAIVKAVICA